MAVALSQADLLALVDQLADGRWHSGEALAEAFGLSRAALAKRVARLADWQLQVEARQGLGYRLSSPMERLDTARVQAAVPGWRVTVEAVTDSTSTQVMAAAPAADPQVVLAEMQTGGRGRQGRSWVSPFGTQLALSVAWSFDAMPPQLGALPLAVGVCCAEVLCSFGLADVGLKWPNDILVGERKLGGILLEHRGEAAGGCRIVIGIGLNLSLTAAQAGSVDQPWINLRDALLASSQPVVGRNRLASELLSSLDGLLRRYAQSGFAPLAAAWAELDLTRGRDVCVIQGEQRYVARACGVDADGALVVETSNGRHTLHAGEISLRVQR